MHVVYNHEDAKTCFVVSIQPQFAFDTMPKKGKKKAKFVKEESDLEIMPMVEIIYEDTKSVTEVESKIKWGQIYPMLQDRKVLDIGLEDLPLFGNILSSRITKVSTRPDLFPCTEVIGCIFPKDNARDMIMYNVEEKGFTSFTLAYLSQAYNLPV